MADKKKKSIQVRIIIVQFFLFLFIFILGARAFQIQILKADYLTKIAETEYTGHIDIQGKRGEIFDRNMNQLGVTIDTLSLAASPGKIIDSLKNLNKVSKILNINQKDLEQKIKTKKKFVWIKRRVSPYEADQIRQLKIKGLFFKNDVIRFYPNRNLAAQIMGFTGIDNTGLEGLEYQYNSLLEGERKKIKITKDAKGRHLNSEKILTQRYAGNSLILTIDRTIQYISETALKQGVEDNKATSGMALVMKPDTGEIMAIAHYPEFNPNSFSKFNKESWRNRAVTDPFEPGSIMKVFVIASALEKQYCTKNSIFFCENGKYKVGRFTIHDTHSYGWLDLGDIVKFSSNIGIVKIAEVTGKKVMHNYLSLFGFGEQTNLGCPAESSGILMPYSNWSDIDTGSIAFGQGISVSAIQLISGISAIANQGILMKPLVIKKIISSQGQVEKTFKSRAVRRVVSANTAKDIKQMMRLVVEDQGTGINAAIQGYSVCGKTGTAQKVNKSGNGYSQKDYLALFVGFAPESKPELVILVVIDEPRKNHFGGVVAAPVFKKIMTESFNYLKISPDMNHDIILAKTSD